MKKKVLFVCVENSCRSQMAEGLARHFAADVIEPYSAGSRPSGRVNPDAVVVMKELGIDISTHLSKGFDALPEKHFDYAITLGCKDTCPLVPASRHIEWKIEDPKGKPIDSFREVRDTLKFRILMLAANLRPADVHGGLTRSE